MLSLSHIPASQYPQAFPNVNRKTALLTPSCHPSETHLNTFTPDPSGSPPPWEGCCPQVVLMVSWNSRLKTEPLFSFPVSFPLKPKNPLIKSSWSQFDYNSLGFDYNSLGLGLRIHSEKPLLLQPGSKSCFRHLWTLTLWKLFGMSKPSLHYWLSMFILWSY